MTLYKQVDEADATTLLSWWQSAPNWVEAGEYPLVLEEVAHALVEHFPEQIDPLRESAASGADLPRRMAALSALALVPECCPELESLLMEAFVADSIELKFRALWGAVDSEMFLFPRHEVEALTTHSDESLAALAEIYLAYAYPKECVEILRNCLTSPNPRKREYACDAVGELEIGELFDLMEELRDDPDPDVRDAASGNLGEN